MKVKEVMKTKAIKKFMKSIKKSLPKDATQVDVLIEIKNNLSTLKSLTDLKSDDLLYLTLQMAKKIKKQLTRRIKCS
jgi:hypothetical protein